MNYDFSGWHKACTKKEIVGAPDGLHIVCYDCGVAADLEAIAGKVSPMDACRAGASDRIIIGKQSTGVDKGASK